MLLLNLIQVTKSISGSVVLLAMFIDLFAKQLNNALNLHSDVNIREQELRFMLDFFSPRDIKVP